MVALSHNDWLRTWFNRGKKKKKKKDRPLADRPTHFFFTALFLLAVAFLWDRKIEGPTRDKKEGKGRKGREREEARNQIELFFVLASWKGIGHHPKIKRKLVGWGWE